ncbi:MAG TPA: PqqD family protein [Actinomycetota bacterium]|nr:PqqD family protein [Actinomycetota bacterium]
MSGERFRRAAGVLSRRFGGEVLLGLRGRAEVDRLEGTAAAVWELLEGPATAAEVAAALAASYDAPASAIERDVRALLSELAARGYVEREA